MRSCTHIYRHRTSSAETNCADIYLIFIFFCVFCSLRVCVIPFEQRSFFSIQLYYFRLYFFFWCLVLFDWVYICADPHKIAIYYIYDTNTRWLLSCNILARMYKYTNKKTKSLKDVLFRVVDSETFFYTHYQKIFYWFFVIYRNPLKSLEDFSSFSRFGYFLFLHSFMFAIYFIILFFSSSSLCFSLLLLLFYLVVWFFALPFRRTFIDLVLYFEFLLTKATTNSIIIKTYSTSKEEKKIDWVSGGWIQ